VIQTMPVTGVEIAPFVVSYKMADTGPLQDLILHSESINTWDTSTVGQNSIQPALRTSTQTNLPELGLTQQQIDDLAPLNFAGSCLFDYLLSYPEASNLMTLIVALRMGRFFTAQNCPSEQPERCCHSLGRCPRQRRRHQDHSIHPALPPRHSWLVGHCLQHHLR
jgi:hypothetical protein